MPSLQYRITCLVVDVGRSIPDHTLLTFSLCFSEAKPPSQTAIKPILSNALATMADVDMSYASDASFVVDDDSEDDFIASDDDDFELVENVAPKSKAKPTKAKTTKAAPKKTAAAKKAPAKKKAALDSLTNLDSDDDVMSIEDVAAPTKTKKSSSSADKEKSIEQIYQKKTQLEHILLRPDTYIGSTEPTTQPMFVLNSDTGRIVERTVTYTPGLYKIFDEILVNAADNKQRDPNMDRMDVTINPEDNTISVKNNGKGIPVEMHKEHKVRYWR